MNLFFLILNLFIVCTNSYKTYNLFRTKLTSKRQIIDSLANQEFFNFYLEQVNAENIVWSPSFERNIDFTYTQKISYKSKPNLSIYPKSFPKVYIHHSWVRDDELFYGNISSKYLNTEMLVRPVQYDTYHCGLLIHGEIKYKNIILYQIHVWTR